MYLLHVQTFTTVKVNTITEKHITCSGQQILNKLIELRTLNTLEILSRVRSKINIKHEIVHLRKPSKIAETLIVHVHKATTCKAGNFARR